MRVAPTACCGAHPETGCTRNEAVTPRGPTMLGVATSFWPDDLALTRSERTQRSLAVWMRHYSHQVAPAQAFAFLFFRASGEQMAAAACSPRANQCMLRAANERMLHTAAGRGRYSTDVDILWRSSNMATRNLRKVLVRDDARGRKRDRPLGIQDAMHQAPLILACRVAAEAPHACAPRRCGRAAVVDAGLARGLCAHTTRPVFALRGRTRIRCCA